jgi:hypothetical protein
VPQPLDAARDVQRARLHPKTPKENDMDTTNMKSQAEDAAKSFKQKASSAMDQAVETSKSMTADVQEKIGQTAGAALDAAASRLDSAKDTLVQGADRLEGKLRGMSEGTDTSHLQSRVVGAVADGVSSLTDRIRDSSIQDLASDVKAFAKRHPGVFVAGAAVVGFAAARFIRSSARNARIARSVTAADVASTWNRGGDRL